jgi:chemotaxis protein MotD
MAGTAPLPNGATAATTPAPADDAAVGGPASFLAASAAQVQAGNLAPPPPGPLPAQTPPPAAQASPAAVVATLAQFSGVVAARAQGGSTAFDIRLDPPELGKVAVRLKIDRDGSVTSHFTVDSSQALSMLRGDLRSLQNALQQAGLKSDPGATSFQLRDGAAGQGGWQSPPQSYQPPTPVPAPRAATHPAMAIAADPLAGQRLRPRAGGLDRLI